jgi:hypothetical protein
LDLHDERLKNGTHLVEVHNRNEAETFLKVNLIGSYPMHVRRYTSLSLSWGVVSIDALDIMADMIWYALVDLSMSEV